MKPNASLLASRDPASLAILGIAHSNFGSSFAGEFDGEFGDDDSDIGDDVGFYAGDIAAEMGAEFGDEVGAAVARKVAARPAVNSKAIAAWKKVQAEKARTQRRSNILNPNKGSNVKVERYAFSMSQALTIGVAVGLAVNGQPDTAIRPQRVTMNAPSPMFAFINEIKVANVAVTVGAGAEDAFNYGPTGVGQTLDMPTLTPANRASVLGTYTGYVPPGFALGMATQFCVTFKGPASVIA
jgi:hypothetical protein